MESQITDLRPSKVKIYNKELLVEQSLVMTMVDGKICSILSEQSGQKCYIYGAFPREMNILEKHNEKAIDPSKFRFGLLGLHAWIRCFERLLHLLCKLEVKKLK
ncbi:hypothetical protein AVEN_102194-1, partial [Araneus ventricosus]